MAEHSLRAVQPDEVESARFRAGFRTYFFDIRKTHDGDYFLSVSESHKTAEGRDAVYVRNRILVYKEDVDRFESAMNNSIRRVRELNAARGGER